MTRWIIAILLSVAVHVALFGLNGDRPSTAPSASASDRVTIRPVGNVVVISRTVPVSGARVIHSPLPHALSIAQPASEHTSVSPTDPSTPTNETLPVSGPGWRVSFSGQPNYPDDSRIAGESGEVTVDLTMNDSGAILATSIISSSGFPRLDRAAVTFVRQSHPLFQGSPPSGTFQHQVTFRFQFQEGPPPTR